MSLKGILKRIFKKGNKELTEQKPQIHPNTCKYKDMTIFSPSRFGKEKEELLLYINAYDENSEAIANETIKVIIDDQEFEEKTNENGQISMPLNLKAGKYTAKVLFPNGEYTQTIYVKIKIDRQRRGKKAETKPKEKKKIDKKKVSIFAPNLDMYLHNEIKYYARLRDYEFNPIEGETIKFTVDGKTFTAVTDKIGYAKVDFGLPEGSYPVKIEYEGSSKYNSLEKEAMLKISMRDIDKILMIDVDHVGMEFKVSNDKIDTLKEFIIRTIKRNKEEKEKIKVLEDINFKIYKGDKIGILGFNGAGKSTLLKILSGIYEPTRGSVKVYGKMAPLLELGAGFDKNYTGKNNIFLKGAFLSMEESFIKEKYDEIVEFSELGEFINYPVKNYSSGMKAKLGFSISTLVEPDILILDEILSVGDIKFKKKSAAKLNSMMKDGITVLLVSHSISQIRKLCTRCIWIENGNIAMDGEVNEVCDAYLANVDKTS